MKIAVSGKGGVGKTTLSSGLARFYAEEGRNVVAIDADPDANLANALGATAEQDSACIPLAKWDDLIEERTGARPGQGGMFSLNPEVSDVVETCGMDIGGVTMLKMGTVERGGIGCMCSEGVFLKAFMRDLLVARDDVAILDMEAGIEHLGRGTAAGGRRVHRRRGAGWPLASKPPTRSETSRATSASKMSWLSRNKVRDAEDAACSSARRWGTCRSLGTLPLSEGVRIADREGRSPYGTDEAFTTRRCAESQPPSPREFATGRQTTHADQEDSHARYR